MAGAVTDAVVAGAGPAGLSVALALAREGVAVTLVERDPLPHLGSAEQAFSAPRDGIAHYLSPHAFLPRGVRELQARLPDVYDALIAVGAQPVELGGDAELRLLGVRRPVIEWALREAVLREPAVRIVSARVQGVVVNGQVRGLVTDQGELRAGLVIDAMGRTSRMRRWLLEQGVDVAEESSEVGLVYYSRYFRLRPGCMFPPASHPFGPRGDLGFALYASFPGDNGTFAAALMVPTWDAELKAIKDEASHERFCSLMPELRNWVDPELVEPVTGVIPMGALRTTWRAYEKRRPPGLVAVADAFCHTDPSFALGLSLSLVHAFTVADLVRAQGLAAAPDAFWEQAAPEARERFELARDISTARLARLRGEQPQQSEQARLFATLVGCAPHDPEAFRVAFRLTGFLDTVASVEAQDNLLARLETLYEQVRAKQPSPTSTRDALLQALRATPRRSIPA